MSYAFTASIRFFAELKLDAGRAKVEVVGGGRAGPDLRTRHLAAGVRYAF